MIYVIISWRIPNGQIEEQYTLPNSKVRTKTTINPIEAMEAIEINFKNEGMNCKYSGYSEKVVWIE